MTQMIISSFRITSTQLPCPVNSASICQSHVKCSHAGKPCHVIILFAEAEFCRDELQLLHVRLSKGTAVVAFAADEVVTMGCRCCPTGAACITLPFLPQQMKPLAWVADAARGAY